MFSVLDDDVSQCAGFISCGHGWCFTLTFAVSVLTQQVFKIYAAFTKCRDKHTLSNHLLRGLGSHHQSACQSRPESPGDLQGRHQSMPEGISPALSFGFMMYGIKEAGNTPCLPIAL